MRRIFLFVVLGACLVPCLGMDPLWAQERRGAGVPRDALPEELKDLDVKDYYVASSLRKVGVIHALEGQVVVIHTGTGEAYFGVEGDPLHEKDSLVTPAESRCRIRFFTEDMVTMAPEATFSVESLYEEKQEGRKVSTFSLLKGKAMFYALRLFRYRDARVTLRTPTAVVGVRGTKFGAEVYWISGKGAAGAGVQVADRGGEIGPYLVQIGPVPGLGPGPGMSMTNCFSEDGFLDVNGKVVGPGEMFRGEVNRVIPTPPEYVMNFQAQTEVRRDDRKPGGERMGPGGREEPRGERRGDRRDDRGQRPAPPQPPLLGLLGMPPLPGLRPPPMENLVNIISRLGPRRIEQQAQAGVLFPEGKVAGQGSFIAAMILDGSPTGLAYNFLNKDPMFFSVLPSLLDAPDGLEKHTAYENAHPDDEQYKMDVKEINAGMDAKVNYFTLNHLLNQNLQLQTFTYTKAGGQIDPKGHEYLTWGYWTDNTASNGLIRDDGPGTYYAATKKIWHVEGDRTHPDYIDFLQRQNSAFQYSGEAKGVFATSAPPAAVRDLTGPFSCQVHFGSRTVSSFNINVSEPGTGNAPVNLVNGSGTVANSGAFQISFPAGSTINGNPTANETGARGAFFGPKAEGVGGTWNAHDGADYWATGEFHGKR
ncbi:MAG: FecR domain-containing protein [Thermodesulfobacteriota bacterium]